MSDDARLAKYRPLVFGIAPELNERPLYLHDVREFDGLPAHAGGCLGWAHNGANTDWPIADRLGSRWEGPGPVIAIDFEAVQVAARSSETFENCVASVLIHEVAHVLPPPPPMADLPPTPERKAFQLEVMALATKAPEAEPGSARDSHGLSFIRRALHLYVRAASLGHVIPIDGLFGRSNVYHTREEFYLPWVLPEALAMRGATFVDIESTPPPPMIAELFNDDLKLYHRFSKGR